jgi:hypothetical protein
MMMFPNPGTTAVVTIGSTHPFHTMHIRSLRALTAVLVLLLGACSGVDGLRDGEGGPGAAAKTPVAAPPPPRRPEVARTEPKGEPGTTAQERYHPRRLIGLDRYQLRKLLGFPDEVRDEASSLIWSFRGRECVLDVALYSSVEGEDLRVLQYNVESRSPKQDPDGDVCVGRMVANARDRQR